MKNKFIYSKIAASNSVKSADQHVLAVMFADFKRKFIFARYRVNKWFKGHKFIAQGIPFMVRFEFLFDEVLT